MNEVKARHLTEAATMMMNESMSDEDLARYAGLSEDELNAFGEQFGFLDNQHDDSLMTAGIAIGVIATRKAQGEWS
jgi:hypothetical protein